MALPDQAEQLIGLRTQQVLMHETGVARYGDIFEGSKVIEQLTDETASARVQSRYACGKPVMRDRSRWSVPN